MSAKRVIAVQYAHHPGGVCRRMYLTVQGLLENDVEVHCLSVDPLRIDDHPNLHRHYVPMPFKGRKGFWFWTFFSLLMPLTLFFILLRRRFRSVLLFSAYDSLLTRLFTALTWTRSFLFLRTIPIRDSTPYRSAFGGRIKLYAAWLGLSLSPKIVVYSEAVHDALVARFGLLNRRVSVLRLPVIVPRSVSEDASTQNPSQLMETDLEENNLSFEVWLDGFTARRSIVCRMFGIPERSKIMLVSGELRARKNTELLLRAINAMESERSVLIISGLGDQTERLKTVVAGFGLGERVIFPGWLPNFGDVLAGCDLYIVPSKYDGISNSMLEALGAGIPVLAADTLETREILQFEELLFDANDVELLADRLDKLAESKTARSELLQLCQKRRRAMNFNWGVDVKRFLEENGL